MTTREGDVLAGRFRLEQEAGAGAMGIVFRARDLLHDATVAVKILRPTGPELLARFEREAGALVALQHPTIVRYVAHGQTPSGQPFLVMEWLSGETLGERLARQRLTILEAVDVGLALASALAGAHGRGVIHRDVKPANVFLVGGSARAAKLLDFGVAHVRRRAALTEVGAMIGTPAYMAPEQARGEDVVDPGSDVFSLGATLFHAIAGTRPFEGADALEIVLAIQTTRAPPLRGRVPAAPAELAALVDAMLAPTLSERPTTEQVFASLSAIRAAAAPRLTMSHVVPVTPRATMVQRAALPVASERADAAVVVSARPRARRRWLVPALVGAFVAGIAGLAVLLIPSAARRAPTRATAAARPARAAPSATTAATNEPAALPCPMGYHSCQPLPFADASAIDPDALLDLCDAIARKHDPPGALSLATFPLTRGTVNLAAANAPFSCQLAAGDRTVVVGLVPGGLSLFESIGPDTRLGPRPPRCRVADAWRNAALAPTDEPVPFTYFYNQAAGRGEYRLGGSYPNSVTLDAHDCQVTSRDRPPPPVSSHGIF